MLVTRVSAEEYDFALARSPALCRPFLAAAGDLRPAACVLADFPADRARPLAALAASAEGRRTLDRLAAAVRAALGDVRAGGGGRRRRAVVLEDGSSI